MSSQKDISSILISEDAIQHILPSILMDAIVLDENYNIIATSENVLDYFGYTNDDLKNKSINFLAGNNDVRAVLINSLTAGYFREKRIHLLSKNKKWISVSMTGFYLGLISDLNGSIILKIKNLDEHDSVTKQLQFAKTEWEDFIDRTSHNLRDPLTAIKRLVSLLKARKDDKELESLINMMAERTDSLDEHLSQLLYLPAKTDQEVNAPLNSGDFKITRAEAHKIPNPNT